MVRKTVKKKKTTSKKSKPKNNENASQNTTSSQANSSSASDLNYTLPEGNHLDSFDIFRSSEEQVLRAKNVLKKDIRASFNRDSSIDSDGDFKSLQLTDPLSTSSVILIQDKENTINIDQTDSDGEQSSNFEQNHHVSLNIAQTGKPVKSTAPEFNGLKSKSSIHFFVQQNAVHTSTPQRSFSVLPGPNQYFQNFENEPTADGNTNGNSDGTIIPQSSNVAARRRRPPREKVQSFTSIQERKRNKATKPNCNIRGNPNAADQIEIDVNHAENLERISTRSRNTDEDENNCVRKRITNSYFDKTTSDDSFSVFDENQKIMVEVEVHRIDELTPINLASLVPTTASISSADKLPKNATTTTKTVDTSRLTHKRSRTTNVRSENRTIETGDGKRCDHQHNSRSNDSVNDSFEVSNRLSAEANHQQNDNITISSASFNMTPIASKDALTTTATIANDHRLTKAKTKVGFNTSCLVHEKSTSSENTSSNENEKIVMKGGKWRRTIVEIRKHKSSQLPRLTLQFENGRNSRQSMRRKSIFVKDIPDRNRLTNQVRGRSQIVTLLDDSETSIHLPDSSPKSSSNALLVSNRQSNGLQTVCDSFDLEQSEKLASKHNSNQSGLCHESISDESTADEIEKSTSNLHIECNRNELQAQLLKRCGQTHILAFNHIYSASLLRKCKKIGEGVFGEVFLNGSIVLKIIPIEGDVEINGAAQKRFDEILQEVIISQELSALRSNRKNYTAGFVEVANVRLVKGSYPAHLLKLWDEYDARKESENDRPDAFDSSQLYIVFELMNCGVDLEAFAFKNAEQSYSAFKQVAISLAVAETQFEFEHRDLHWGNCLLENTKAKCLTFYLNGKPIEVQTHGIKATIIDYTLSRIVYKNCCLFQDLAADPELFEATGDYQYDIYRMMRDKTKNCWAVFEPYTNVLWLHYIIDKMTSATGVKYTAKRGVKHRQIINELVELQNKFLDHQSATEYAENL